MIEEVYYETSVIRDFFYHLKGIEREDFNYELLSFCFDDLLNNMSTKEELKRSIKEIIQNHKYKDKKRKGEEKSEKVRYETPRRPRRGD